MKSLKLVILALIVTAVLLPFGILWNLGKSFIECFQWKFWLGIYKFLHYWYMIFYQAWISLVFWIKALRNNTESFYDFCFNSALALDYMWNATSGELIEDIVTWKETTAFGDGNVTISAAIGQQEEMNKLTPTGVWFSGFLNKVFNEEAHCVDSWLKIKENYFKC